MTYLKDKAKNYLKKVNGMPPLTTFTPGKVRALRAAVPPPKVKTGDVYVENTHFTARDGAEINVRIYKPKQQGLFSAIVYYHGGGWVLNDLNTCDASCSLLAEQAKAIVISVEYRLAPEYKFPVPLHDAYDALLWVKENVAYNGFIAVAGDSAGGNLAAAVTLIAKEQHESIDAQILLYPVTELTYRSPSYETYSKGYGLDQEEMKWFGNYYVRTADDAYNPLVAPLLADVEQLPRAFIIVAENDVLRDEGKAYADKLQAAGVPVTFSIAEGIVHSFFTKNDTFAEEIDETIARIAAFLYEQ